MKRYNNYIEQENEDANQWMSFTNVMIAVLLIFTIAFIIGLLRSTILTKNAQIQYHSEKDKIEQVQMQVSKEQETIVEELRKQLAETENKLLKQEENIRKMSEVKNRITNELVDALGKLELNMDIDKQTGAVRFSEALFFDKNKKTINKNGEDYLNKFFPVYISVLLSDTNKNYIDQIVIEGHSDEDGYYLYNLELSYKRAYEVAKYILYRNLHKTSSVEFPEKYISVNGRSYGQPVQLDGVIDRQKSRRVEFKFRLKDIDINKEMQKNLQGAD